MSQSAADVWEGADWVLSVSDSVLEFERINTLFISVIFATVPEEEEEVSDAVEAPRRKLLSRKEMEDNDELKNAQLELDGEDGSSHEEDEGSILDWDKISEAEAEERQRGGLEGEMDEFQRWIDQESDDEVSPVPPLDEEGVMADSIKTALERVGLGEPEEAFAPTDIPERFQELFRQKAEADQRAIRLDRYSEATWILMHLTRPGQALGGSKLLELKFRDPSCFTPDMAKDDLVKAVKNTLKLMLEEHLEPGYVMVYHKRTLEPILFELEPPTDEASVQLSAAFASKSGTRQKLSYDALHVEAFFNTISREAAPDKPGDPERPGSFVCRRPAFIELGHLLVDILELDLQCQRLELARHRQLEVLRTSDASQCLANASILERTLFTDAIEADMWKQYTTFLVSGTAGRRTQELERRRLTAYFGEFCISAVHYHENLAHRRAYHQWQNSTDLDRWKTQMATDTKQDATFATEIFFSVIIEQFSILPALRKRVLDFMLLHCNLVVENVSTG